MRLTVIGCSPAWPNPGEAHSGYLVEGPGRLLLDCGPGVLSRLRSLGGGWPAIDAVVLSHLHHDHYADIVAWAWGALVGPGIGAPAPELRVAAGSLGELAAIAERLGSRDMFERAFHVAEYPVGEPFHAAGFELLALPVPHHGTPACGLRIADGRSTLAYSGDSGPGEALAELARGADLFLCEATLAEGAVDSEPRGHQTAGEAFEAFAASGARRLVLTHRPSELPAPDGAEVARGGLAIDL